MKLATSTITALYLEQFDRMFVGSNKTQHWMEHWKSPVVNMARERDPPAWWAVGCLSCWMIFDTKQLLTSNVNTTKIHTTRKWLCYIQTFVINVYLWHCMNSKTILHLLCYKHLFVMSVSIVSKSNLDVTNTDTMNFHLWWGKWTVMKQCCKCMFVANFCMWRNYFHVRCDFVARVDCIVGHLPIPLGDVR